MMNAALCDLCKGKRYPRQCRNLRGFRRKFAVPAECPHGIALNNLPIGDNAPTGQAGGVHMPPDGVRSYPIQVQSVACKHAEVYPKCATKVVCKLDLTVVRVVHKSECAKCERRET